MKRGTVRAVGDARRPAPGAGLSFLTIVEKPVHLYENKCFMAGSSGEMPASCANPAKC